MPLTLHIRRITWSYVIREDISEWREITQFQRSQKWRFYSRKNCIEKKKRDFRCE